MAILLVFVALYSAVGISVESASTKTNCDFVQPAKSCIQQSCVQSPCTMLCGLTAQYDTCQQSCDSRIGECDALNCVASRTCIQICSRSNCGNITCDAIDCTQTCSTGNCSTMACPHKSTKTCSQLSGKEMTCKANSCTQVCTTGNCSMTCSSSVKKCHQVCSSGNCLLKCDSENCMVDCFGKSMSINDSTNNKTNVATKS
ncbi:unnamed protein product, partial [Porites lobata]